MTCMSQSMTTVALGDSDGQGHGYGGAEGVEVVAGDPDRQDRQDYQRAEEAKYIASGASRCGAVCPV